MKIEENSNSQLTALIDFYNYQMTHNLYLKSILEYYSPDRLIVRSCGVKEKGNCMCEEFENEGAIRDDKQKQHTTTTVVFIQ